MFKEFKDFAMKGSLIDIAVGFVMGAAFNKLVSAFTGGIVSPLIGLLFNADFKDLSLTLKEGAADETGAIVGKVTLMYGEFLTYLIDFLIVAAVMFMIIKAINSMKKKEVPAPVAPKGPTQEELLAQIRDLLAKK
ncbi:large conductance mechanosensitive channel protein MscL [Lutibacter sp.]|uniref:large conductance mechanosensitive channel protein MscL n=1 Tax=Lutibacter sp. TaxID=1925666 RepID=UPI002734FE0C|nr:large conductance mechanosensitive channel protein MscL [Lutibacter sp.]MDP3314280.1 large conductance mechanosensitive channel protein MscL [Lutibacter sp.]